jgi:hypothetical protein
MYKCTVYTGEDKKERKETTRRRMLSFVAASTLKKLFAKRFEECVREETAHLATLKSKSIQVDNLLNLLRDCRDWIRNGRKAKLGPGKKTRFGLEK